MRVNMPTYDINPVLKESPGRQDKVVTEFYEEINFGIKKFGNYNSYHEAYAVIKEEFDELWDELKVNADNRDLNKVYKEAIQVAATSYRLAEEIYIDSTKQNSYTLKLNELIATK